MKQDPLDEVLPFYAGLTQLTRDDNRKMMFKVLELSLNNDVIARELEKSPTASNDPRQKALGASMNVKKSPF